MIDELLPLARTDRAALQQAALDLAARGRVAGVHSIIGTISTAEPTVVALASNITEEISFDTTFASGSAVPDAILVDGQLPIGDFLWEPIAATYPIRRHLNPATATELQSVAEHWREQGPPEYVL